LTLKLRPLITALKLPASVQWFI